jgi:hypothetical protein
VFLAAPRGRARVRASRLASSTVSVPKQRASARGLALIVAAWMVLACSTPSPSTSSWFGGALPTPSSAGVEGEPDLSDEAEGASSTGASGREDSRPTGSASQDPGIVSPSILDPSGRLVIALYYPWYNQTTWADPVLTDRPMIPYDGSDPDAITRHVRWAREAGIDALVSAWFGPLPSNSTETNFKTLLNVSRANGMRAGLLIETDSDVFYPSSDALRGTLEHALTVHAAHPAYFRYEGKPVLVFWRPRAIWLGNRRAGRDGPDAVEAWRRLRDAVDPDRRSLWIAEGEYVPYLEVFDGISPYSVAWSRDPGRQLVQYGNEVRAYESRSGTKKLWVATAMPGYDDTGVLERSDRFKVNRDSGAYYEETFAGAVASRPDWISISSFNEWVEGHQIEPSVTYGDLYLTLTRKLAGAWKDSK